MNKALGKGLEALIKTHDTEESTKYLSGQLPIEKIFANKNQLVVCFQLKHIPSFLHHLIE